MRDMLCRRQADCNIISTRTLDFLWQTGIPYSERARVAVMPGHLTLDITLENGASIYFNNASAFLAEDYYKDSCVRWISGWQILARNFADIATELYKDKNADAAIAEARKALTINPMDIGARRTLAAAFQFKKDWIAAAIELSKIDFIDAAYADALDHYIPPEEAFFQFRGLHDEPDPNLADTHFKLGMELRNRHNLAGAAQEFRKAIALDPDWALAHTLLATTIAGNYPEAEREYQRAIELDPSNDNAHFNLGMIFFYQNKMTEANAEFQMAIAINPKWKRWKWP